MGPLLCPDKLICTAGYPQELRMPHFWYHWEDLLLVLNCVSVCMLFQTQVFNAVMSLNADCYQRGEFVYRKQPFDPNTVEVTALHLVSQIRCLCIGYSFGSFQLYSLCPMVVVCSSPVSQDVAVTHFAYMEPENDPRSFVYLWVATGASTAVEERYNIHDIILYKFDSVLVVIHEGSLLPFSSTTRTSSL